MRKRKKRLKFYSPAPLPALHGKARSVPVTVETPKIGQEFKPGSSEVVCHLHLLAPTALRESLSNFASGAFAGLPLTYEGVASQLTDHWKAPVPGENVKRAGALAAEVRLYLSRSKEAELAGAPLCFDELPYGPPVSR